MLYLKMEQTNPSVYLFLAWINYVISFGFNVITLSNISLFFSIVSSIVYIWVTISKHLRDKNQNNQTKT